MSLLFSTKARTLKTLAPKIKSAQIAPIFIVSASNWKIEKEQCLVGLEESIGNGPWIVRSSSDQEDKSDSSNAGKFLSIPNVSAQNVKSAVDQVFESYENVGERDEVLIQPFLNDVIRSGVIFSHDPSTCAPYRVVNWSEDSDTSIVTSGIGGKVWIHAAKSPVRIPAALKPIVDLVEELEDLFDNQPIDCEFAVTRQDTGGDVAEILWLLQVRPLVLTDKPELAATQMERLKIIESKLNQSMTKQPFLMGEKTLYGVMPDWNPAEIIGIKPKPLALSLYRELVTDSIWAYQRHNYGYRNLRSFPLMVHFFGLPYIDVRLSFNSFVPADLKDEIANKLVDYYIGRLKAEPALHDKVEFEIVLSCSSFDLEARLKELNNFDFSRNELREISQSLQRLTNRIIHPERGLWCLDAKKLDVLKSRREQLKKFNPDRLTHLYWLLEDAKRYGTLPFAGLARAGFVAMQMLSSLVNSGVFSDTDYSEFMTGISTVTGKMAHDRTIMDKNNFLKNYGHLRPGSYDILSTRYDETPDKYFDWTKLASKPSPTTFFELNSRQEREIFNLIKQNDLSTTPRELISFIKAGIELRELAKFHFTRNLSDSLVLIEEIGAVYGLSREDLAYSDISVFKELYIGGARADDAISKSVEEGKSRYLETLKISLPPLIANPKDIWSFELLMATPNFITQKQITASVSNAETNKNLADMIVCIPNADPGFDWLFSHPIAGLITAWGGPNSHMAIRAGEIGLPALIGAGDVLYNQLSKAQRLHIDCASRRVEILS